MSDGGPVHVLHVTDHLRAGGLQRVLVRLAADSTRRGDVVGVLAGDGELWAELPDDVRRYRMPGRHAGPVDVLRRALVIRRILRDRQWQVVHAHQRGVALLARVAVVGKRTRVVEHVHNTFEMRPGPRRMLSFRGHRVIACGSGVYSMLVDDVGRSPGRVALVRNAVPDLGAGHDLTLPVCRPGAVPRIVNVGRLAPQKDPLRFLSVMRHLAADGCEVHAEWAGGGELAEAVAADLRRAPLPTTRFTGPTDAATDTVLSSDLLVLTSRWEGLPLVALEALALGRGIVAPDVGSLRDVVVPGENGLLYPPGSTPEDIAARIAGALDPATLRRWGAASRRRFEQDGGMERFTDGVRAVYAGLGGRESARRG